MVIFPPLFVDSILIGGFFMCVMTEAEFSDLRTKVEGALDKNHGSMTIMLAREFDVPEREIFRVYPGEKCVELDQARWKELVRSFEGMGKLFVLVSSKAAVMECQGEFGGFSEAMGYLNVQTDTLDMHIREMQIDTVFALIKNSHFDNVETLSFQFFDPDGWSGFKVFLTFGGKAPSNELRAKFDELVAGFRLN